MGLIHRIENPSEEPDTPGQGPEDIKHLPTDQGNLELREVSFPSTAQIPLHDATVDQPSGTIKKTTTLALEYDNNTSNDYEARSGASTQSEEFSDYAGMNQAKIEKLPLKQSIIASIDLVKVAFSNNKRQAFAKVALSLPVAASGTAIGWLSGLLIDSVSKNPEALITDPKVSLFAFLGGSVVFGLMKAADRIATKRCDSVVNQALDSHLREGMRSQNIRNLISKEFDNKFATVRGEVYRLYNFADKPMELLTNTLQIAASFAFVGVVGPEAILPLTVAGVAQGIAAWSNGRDFERTDDKINKPLKSYYSTWYEFQHLKTLKEMILTRKDKDVAEICKDAETEVRIERDKLNTRTSMRDLAAEVVTLGALGVALYACVEQVTRGAMSAGELSAIIMAIHQFTGATTGIIENTFGQLKNISVVKKYLDLCRPPQEPERSPESSAEITARYLNKLGTPEICFNNVSYNYPSEVKEAETDAQESEIPVKPFVLQDVSFTLKPGTIIGIAGENGSGKSTIVNLLLGLFKPAAGSVTVNGVDLESLNHRTEWLPRFGVLLQEHKLFVGVNIHNQIVTKIEHAWNEAKLNESNSSLTDNKRRNFDLDRVTDTTGVSNEIQKIKGGYEAIIGDWLDNGVSLSGGQSQKVALARALESRPDILILDEPTASLDASAARSFWNKLKVFFAENDYHPTVLVITHKMDIFPQCDHVLVMSNGSLITEGTHDNLMAEGSSIYAKLFNDYTGANPSV